MIGKNKDMVPEMIKVKTSGFFFRGAQETIYNGFPIKFFDKLSYLEIIASWFTSFPEYLTLENLENKDSVVRMKLVMQAVLSTIYRIVKPSKSFNPVLGETF